MSSRYGIIWDMDGILADSNEYHWAAWQETLTRYGLTLTREQFDATCGMTDADMLPLLYGVRLTPEQVVEISDAKEAAYRRLARQGIEPFPGVRRWLSWFGAQRYRQALASSATMENIAATLQGLDIWPWFDCIITGARLAASKPDPAIFLDAAAGLGLTPNDCLVIEDSIAGVQAAKRAGMACLAVTNTRPAHDLAVADLIVASLEDVSETQMERLLQR